jgi:hypothetical protein
LPDWARYASEYRDIYHQSRISLCCSAMGDVARRILETAVMCCVVLTDPCPDFPYLEADGIAIYTDIPNAILAVRQLLPSHAMAESVIERPYAWVKPHTWDARAKSIVDWFNE